MTFSLGTALWVPCEVMPGPLPTERMVLVEGKHLSWYGFTDEANLERPIENGATRIRAHVVKVEGSQVTIKLQGSSPTTSAVSGPEEEIAADAVEG